MRAICFCKKNKILLSNIGNKKGSSEAKQKWKFYDDLVFVNEDSEKRPRRLHLILTKKRY